MAEDIGYYCRFVVAAARTEEVYFSYLVLRYAVDELAIDDAFDSVSIAMKRIYAVGRYPYIVFVVYRRPMAFGRTAVGYKNHSFDDYWLLIGCKGNIFRPKRLSIYNNIYMLKKR
jgi:hypothetical protein